MAVRGNGETKAKEETVRSLARGLLETGAVEGVLALRLTEQHVEPYLFTEPEELERLSVAGHYTVARMVLLLKERKPDARLAVVARGCDERHLVELEKKGSVAMERLELIGLACTHLEAAECRCVKPYPRRVDAGESIGDVPFEKHEELAGFFKMDVAERRRYWSEIFARCIKCYGCRNVCPLCNCDDCRLETSAWVRVGEIPPEYPSFHFIRALHMADKCVGCGACGRACPMSIPLGAFHQLIREELKRLFAYEAGADAADMSPLNTDLVTGPLEVALDEL
ncbi:MAG: 4Fe-4S binding protein [Candidatus Geothermincolia bacterium]